MVWIPNDKKNAKPLNPKEKKQVKNIVQNELKRDDELKQYVIGATDAAYSAGSTAVHLTAVAQGVLDSQHVGDKLKMKAATLRIRHQNNYGATSNPFNNTRIIVFQYNNSDMAPTNSQIFLNGGGLASVNSFSARNIDYLNKYTFLYDKTFKTVGAIGAIATTPLPPNYEEYHTIKIPLKWAKKLIQFQAATTNNTFGLWLLVLGDQTSIASNPLFSYDFNLNFYDA